MVSIQLDSFDFDKLGIHQFNILIEQNNTSRIPETVFTRMKEKYQHIYFLGNGSSSISNKIPTTNHFDSNHFQFQLSSVYEQIRNTNISTHSLLVVHSNNTILQKLINFPCFYDIIQNRKNYNMGILLITDIFPKKFDILKKQLDYCIFGSIIQEQELLQFVGPLFDPPYLYLQVHKTVYNENNFIVIIWNSSSNNLQDRIYWFDMEDREEGVDVANGALSESAPLSAAPVYSPQPVQSPVAQQPQLQQAQHQLQPQLQQAQHQVQHQSSLTNADKQRIWKKIGMIENLLADIKEYLNPQP
jgi:hypothetical protein